MDWSSTFHHIFKEEGDDLTGISERLREIASNQMRSNDERERECGYAAEELVAGMDRHCPLSLKVIHGLTRERGGGDDTLEGCMERERRAQIFFFFLLLLLFFFAAVVVVDIFLSFFVAFFAF